jgi:hypothetical protein
MGIPPSSMLVEAIPEYDLEESEMNSVIEREKDDNRHK